jgi:hypothetical protein
MARSPLLDAAFGFMPAQVVYTAAELRLADALAAGPRSSPELAEETGTHAPSLHRLLRALAAMGVVAQQDEDLFALTPLGTALTSDDPGSVRGLLRLFCGPEVWRSWGDLTETVRTGEPAWDRQLGKPAFEYMAEHPELEATFNAAMAEHTRDLAPAVIEAWDFGRFRTIADLGGGDGTLLAAIMRAAPRARGVLFELPGATEAARRTFAEAGLAGRCEVAAGDFFESVPEGPDAYLLKSVIHDWDDARAAAILRSCRKAMPPDGRVLLVEYVLPPVISPELPSNVMSDINMLVVAHGKERTEREFRDLFADAGLRLTAMSDALPGSSYRVLEAAPDDTASS